MKILMANKFFYLKGGAENSFFETAELLKSKGHEVVFFSMKHPKNRASEYEDYFVPEIDYEKKGALNALSASLRMLYSFDAKNRMARLVRDRRPDLAHLNNIYHQLSPSILRPLKKSGIPIVMTLRDYKVVCASYSMVASDGAICESCRGGRYHQAFMKGCFKDSRLKSLLGSAEMYLHHNVLKLYDLVDVFISPSRFLKDKVAEMGFRGRVEYLPNFTSLGEDGGGHASGSAQNGWKENAIVYFGRISKEKGLPTLMEAVRGLPVRLKVIGEGPLKEHLSVTAPRNVDFLGYKTGEELKKEVSESMFVVLPSEWYENNPRTVLEGFALGKPAVGARVGGIPELVRDGQTGLTYAMGDAGDLRQKLTYFLEHPSEIGRMGGNARALVAGELSRERHYQKLMEIYHSVIPANAGGAA